jgi:hypothetical protein
MVISLIIISCAQQQVINSPLEGVWQVVSFQQMHGDTVVFQFGKDFTGGEMKMWYSNYFNFVGQYKLGDSIVNNYGGGTFKLEGNRYEENLTYPEKATVKLLLEIKNDTITQTWPVDDNGLIIKSNYYMQKLARR